MVAIYRHSPPEFPHTPLCPDHIEARRPASASEPGPHLALRQALAQDEANGGPAPEEPSTPDRRAIARVNLLEILRQAIGLEGSDAPLQELLDLSASLTASQLRKLAGAVVSGGRAVSGQFQGDTGLC